MKFATRFATLLPQPSRAKHPKPQFCAGGPDWPAYMAIPRAGEIFLEAARHEFPGLLEIKASQMELDDFTPENVCASIGLSPEAPFCVINSAHDPNDPCVRYRDGGFPIYGSASSYELVTNLAELCGMGGRAPSWVSSVVKYYLLNQRSGVYAPFTITYREAAEYSQFLHELFHQAERRFDPCLIEAILADELVYFENALVPDVGVRLLYHSMMFSAPVVDLLVTLALDESYRPAHLPSLLVQQIEENLPFWARCRGVIAHIICSAGRE